MQLRDGRFFLAATDLSNHLACHHLTELDARVAAGLREKPVGGDPDAEVLRERGLRHEAAYVESLRAQGLEVVELHEFEGGTARERTLAAMREGVHVIVQAALGELALGTNGDPEAGRWSGRADILRRVEQPSSLGAWSYEVLDTKLAQQTRGGTVLQLCLYSDLLGRLQGKQPERMYVVRPDRDFPDNDGPDNGDPDATGTPGFATDEFRYDDFQAYYRHVRARLEAFADGLEFDGADARTSTYPEPVPHCDVCRWWATCTQQRRADDHLSLVAGLSRLHADELRSQGRPTRTALADASTGLDTAPRRGQRATYERLRLQAAIQVQGEREQRLLHELLPVDEVDPGQPDGTANGAERAGRNDARRGFRALPPPDRGDIFLDFEGDPFVDTEGGGGLEYLLGYAHHEGPDGPGDPGDPGKLAYTPLWALDRAAEKRAFETFIDFIHERLAQHPGLNVYHFAPYEPAALKRLASRHATRELELDWLLRAERFIDLHAIARGALRASVESYSLKQLERFASFERRVDLRQDAGPALRRVQHALELGCRDDISAEDRELVAGYNEDDCRALPALRDWLESLRLERLPVDADRPRIKEGDASDKAEDRSAEVQALVDQLTLDVPAAPEERTPEQAARWLLAHLVEYFHREDKVAWWEFFARREADDETLLKDRKAIVGLEFVEKLPPTSKRQKVEVHRYRFPAQEVSLKLGTKLRDPRKELDDGADELGKVEALDLEQRLLDLRMTLKSTDRRPHAVHAEDRVSPDPLDGSLLELAKWVAEHGVDAARPEHRAERDLLLRAEPRRADSSRPLREPEEDLQAALARAALDLDGGVLAIQGPPGTGKTYSGARLIVELLRRGKRIGISAVSHEVVRNLLAEIHEAAEQAALPVTITHKVSSTPRTDLPPTRVETTDKSRVLAELAAPPPHHVVGGTAWLWANPAAAATLDYLILDEAGQLSLAHVLAAARSAKNLILLGDPQQLQQPQRGAHPEGAEISALSHYLGQHKTIAPTHGFFLNETWRLHPSICRFTSELYYESRLTSRKDLNHQTLHAPALQSHALPTHGFAYLPVPHEHNQSRSLEEVAQIESLVRTLLTSSTTWTDRHNKTHDLTPDDILVIAPYNAQVAALTTALTPHQVRAGTVDKFQGQEAPVVLYSLTSSTPEDAPRGLTFLLDPHRLNVATSRARCLCILVASPHLLEADCRTPEQMSWVNGFCRYVELADAEA